MTTTTLEGEMPRTRKGSTANAIAALCSFFIPGLGQLIQGRPFVAAFFFLVDVFLWFFWLGWLMHLVAALEAAVHDPG